jgi:hypothetical protein
MSTAATPTAAGWLRPYLIVYGAALAGLLALAAAVATIPGLGPTVFIGSYNGDLYALNAKDGSTEWSTPVPTSTGKVGISGSAVVVNHTVYASSVYGKGSYGFNARTGQRDFYYPDGSYTTAVADRNALFLMGKYVLYKFVPHNAKLPKLKAAHRRHRHRHRHRRRSVRRPAHAR